MRLLLFTLTLILSINLSNASVKDSVGTKVKDGKKYIIHQVEGGQTLYSISKIYKVSVTDIKNWNGMTDNALDLNQKILILSKNQNDVVSNSVHTVAAGETLYSISKKHGITVDQLKSMNKLSSTGLDIGQKLNIAKNATPDEEAKNTSPETHKVGQGETLYAIARKYRTSVEALKKLNGLKDNTLEIGQELFLKSGVKVANKSTVKTPIKENEFVNEEGQVGLLTHDDFQNKYAYCFHQTAPKGTIIKIKNSDTGKFMYARVMGKSKETLLQVNPTVMNKIGSKDNMFKAQLSYYL